MLYILYGSDAFSRREALDSLRGELDRDGALATNTTVLDAREVKPEEVFAVCDTVPFLGACRLVIVEGALSQAQTRGRRRPSPRDHVDADEGGPWWGLAEYATRMPSQTTLVMLDGEGIAEDVLDALRPVATVRKFSLPAPRDAAGWVQARARAKAVRIDRRACVLMAELVGNDTWILASELDKLSVYAAGAAIGENEVRALVPDVRNTAGYLLADAIADGKSAQATKLLHELLAKEHPPAVLLLTIEQRFRRIAVAREMTDARLTSSAIGAKLRIDSSYAVERLLEQAARYPMTRVRWALDRIAEADFGVKQGTYDEEIALELLVQELAAREMPSQAA